MEIDEKIEELLRKYAISEQRFIRKDLKEMALYATKLERKNIRSIWKTTKEQYDFFLSPSEQSTLLQDFAGRVLDMVKADSEDNELLTKDTE